MEIAKNENFMALRLDHGEDILLSLARAVKDETSTLFVSTGLGMISEFELGYFDRGTYVRKFYAEPHELLAMQGSVACEGDPRIHIHATVANTKHEAFGGHLLRGKAWMSNEIGMLRILGTSSKRILDSEKKVGILRFV